jgi:hypothetical protein
MQPCDFQDYINVVSKKENEFIMLDNHRFARLCALIHNMFSDKKLEENDFFAINFEEEKKEQSVEEILFQFQRYCARFN